MTASSLYAVVQTKMQDSECRLVDLPSGNYCGRHESLWTNEDGCEVISSAVYAGYEYAMAHFYRLIREQNNA